MGEWGSGSTGRTSMWTRIQPCAESSKCNPLSARRRYAGDNIHEINSRTDFEEIAGATNDRERNVSTAEGNTDDRQSDETFR